MFRIYDPFQSFFLFRVEYYDMIFKNQTCLRSHMGRRLVFLLIIIALIVLQAAGSAERNKYLDTALAFLEDGNPFLVRYNQINGTEITPLCPLGCPYFWGGRHVVSLLKPYSPSHSSDYYHTDQKYLYGLDCVGFIQWIQKKAGYETQLKISDLLKNSEYRKYRNTAADRTVGSRRTEALRIGDLVAIQHTAGGYHMAMYCGTLSFYGYTAETLPEELIPYIEYPLIIHCTGSSDYHVRYREYLQGTDITPPFGGVIVSILDVPISAATSETPDAIDLRQPCFELEGYHLQITDLAQEKQYRWVRWRLRQKRE